MGWESFDVIRFDLGLLLQGQTRIAKLKVLITHFLWVLEVRNVKPTCSWGKKSRCIISFTPLLLDQNESSHMVSLFAAF